MQVAATGASSCMSPAVQKGPLGDLHANGPSPREERVEGTPRRLTQGATARLGDLALLRSILLRMAQELTDTDKHQDDTCRAGQAIILRSCSD